jgi:hypothetical protein
LAAAGALALLWRRRRGGRLRSAES